MRGTKSRAQLPASPASVRRAAPAKSPMAKSRGGTPGSTRRPADDARNSILSAAQRLFYEQGIRAVSVDAVAEAAGVTKRTLYYHFKSKDDLVAAYLEARDVTTLNALRSTPNQRGPHPGDRILSVFDFLESWFSSPGFHGCPFNNAVAEQGVTEAVAAIVRRHKATVRAWFTELAQAGGAKHADAVGAQLLVLLDGALNGAAVFANADAAIVARATAEAVLDAADVARSRPAPQKPGRREVARSKTP